MHNEVLSVYVSIINQPCDVVETFISSLPSPSPIALTAVTLMVYEVLGIRGSTVPVVISVTLVISDEPLPLHLTVYLSRGTPPVELGADHVILILLQSILTTISSVGGFGPVQ